MTNDFRTLCEVDKEVKELVDDLERVATDLIKADPDQSDSALTCRRSAKLLESLASLQPIQKSERLPDGLLPTEYYDMDSGARIESEPSEDMPGRECWTVKNCRKVSPFAEFPSVLAAWEAIHVLPQPNNEETING